MITIEEKIKLFTKIVYDQVERENKCTIDRFNEEYSNLIEEKKKEFTLQADENFRKNKREIEKEASYITSKARTEARKLVLEEEKELVDLSIKLLCDYAKEFTKTIEYEEYFSKALLSIENEVKSSEGVTVIFTTQDKEKFRDLIQRAFMGKDLEIIVENDIIGGVVVIDRRKHLRIDFSLASKIFGSKDLIGQRIADMFN